MGLPFYHFIVFDKNKEKHFLVISCISTQVDKSTPAPAVLIVVRKSSSFSDFDFATEIKEKLLTSLLLSISCIYKNPQAALSLVYLTSSNILMLIEFTGFATWVRGANLQKNF